MYGRMIIKSIILSAVCNHLKIYVVRCPLWSTFSNIFWPEATRPVEAECHMEPPWVRRKKVCSNGHGHMTKMVTMLITGNNLQKSSFPEPNDRDHWNLVYTIGHSSSTKFVQMKTPGWPFSAEVKFGTLFFFIGKHLNSGFLGNCCCSL